MRDILVQIARATLGYKRVNTLVAKLDKIRTRNKKLLLTSWLESHAQSLEFPSGPSMVNPEQQALETRESSSDVWSLWLSGWSNAPKIVKEIARANDALFPEVTFRRINLDEAISLTNVKGATVDLYRQGIIKPWGLADLLRMRLVFEHGGSWADATVLFGPEGVKVSSAAQPAFINVNPNENQPRALDWTIITWFFTASAGYPFLKIWASLLEDSYHKHGQLTAFDSFLIATFIQRKGRGVPAEHVMANSLLIKDMSTHLIKSVTSGSNLRNIVSLHHEVPFHKFSYKVSDADEKRILNAIQTLVG